MNANNKSPKAKLTFAGRAALIADLVAQGKRLQQIIKIVKAEFKGSSPIKIRQCVAAHR